MINMSNEDHSNFMNLLRDSITTKSDKKEHWIYTKCSCGFEMYKKGSGQSERCPKCGKELIWETKSD